MKNEKESVDEPLRKAIANFLRSRPRADQLASDALANIFANREGILIGQWITIKLTRMIERELRAARPDRPDPFTPFLFGLAGSGRLTLREGSRSLRHLTVGQLREALSVLQRKAQVTPRTEAISSLIENMSPLAKTHHGLTVERYCELRAAGVEVTEQAGKKKAAGRKETR